MSAVAGVFWRDNARAQMAEKIFEALARAVRESAPPETVTEAKSPNCRLLKFDFCAYDSPGLAISHDSLATVCGHPYIDELRGSRRYKHLDHLSAAVRNQNLLEFRKTRGSFSLVRVDSKAGATPQLTLAVDALGVRPLYYIEQGETVVFASTLSSLRYLDASLLGGPDERALVETAVLGFPLGDRTRWRRAQCVPPGCVLTFKEEGIQRLRYWSMSDIAPIADSSNSEALREIFDRFTDSVNLRASGQSVVMAMLSGGMDSRAVVASLRNAGLRVNTLNFGPSGSQDLVYGRKVAVALGCNHSEYPMDSGTVLERTRTALGLWYSSESVRRDPADYPRVIWTGDGGSVTLGHVYLSDGMVAAAESGDSGRAIDMLIADQSWYVPRGALRKDRVNQIAGYPKEGLLDALEVESSADPGRRLHMMLMATDQRRHMHPHFELIYQHRCEVQLPFFDRKFVEAVLSRPLHPFLNHRFYNKWLDLFPKPVTAVPWQSYPGHEPCPVVSQELLTYQWTKEFGEIGWQAERQTYLRAIGRALVSEHLRHTPLSRWRVALAWMATALGIRDLTYALKFCALLSSASSG